MAALLQMVSAAEDQTITYPPGLLTNATIGMWIQPNCLFGIVFFLMFTMVFYFGISQMAQIQTPILLREKTLNWGRIEENE